MVSSIALADPEHDLSLRNIRSIINEMQTVLDTFNGGSTEDWEPTRLNLGSLDLEVRPPNHRPDLDILPSRLVGGLGHLAVSATLPADWTYRQGRAALRLLKSLSLGSELRYLDDGAPRQTVYVDVKMRDGLEKATTAKHKAYGTVTGHLRVLRDSSRGMTAILRSETGDDVTVEFEPSQARRVHDAFGQHRVAVTGDIDELADGIRIRVRMRDLEILPTRSRLRPDDLRGGFYPNITGDMDVNDYLALLRGPA